jgi:ribonuclease HI
MYKAYICSWDIDRRYVGAYTIYKNDKLIKAKRKIQMPFCTCNEAEYLTLHKLLMRLQEMDIQNCKIYTHVELVSRQINGQWKVKTPSLINYVEEGKRLIREVNGEIEWLSFGELHKWVNGEKIIWRIGM